MRSIAQTPRPLSRALVVGGLLLLAGAVNAAPATPSDVGRIMQHLGMDGMGRASTAALIGVAPGLKDLGEKDRACATTQLSAMLDGHMRAQIARELGDDGAALVSQWTTFMATPAGIDMGRTFKASAQLQAGVKAAAPVVSEDHKVQIAEFMEGPAFQGFIAGLSADGGVPDDVGQRMAETLQRECRISFDPEQMS